MAIRIRSKNSVVKDKAPLPADLEIGELALNAHQDSPAIYLKDAAGAVRKVAGSDAVGDKWTRTGTELSPKTAGDSVFIGGAVKVGGTTAAPNITLTAGGAGTFNDRLTVKKLVDPNFAANIWKAGSPDPLVSGYTLYLSSGEAGNPSSATRLGFGATGITDSAAIMLTGDFVTPFFGFTHGISIGGTLPASPKIQLKADGNINAKGAIARVYADNTAAKAGGLVDGDIYRTATGQLMIVFT